MERKRDRGCRRWVVGPIREGALRHIAYGIRCWPSRSQKVFIAAE
jgi:hypothetical protein